VLARADDFDGLMEMFTKLSGRKPTPEELERAKVEHAQLLAKLEEK